MMQKERMYKAILQNLLFRWMIIVLTCLCNTGLCSGQSGRQISQGRHNLPASFSHPVKAIEAVDVIVTRDVNLTAVHLDDQKRERWGGPYRFAVRQSAEADINTSGTWEEIDSQTRLWRLHIVSPQATSLSLGFSNYNMPAGGKLFIYSADGKQVLGPYTEHDNARHHQLWTPLVFSDDIVAEVTIPADEAENLKLALGAVNHGYRNISSSRPTVNAVGDSAWCEINVACPEGDGWRDQIRSVAMYYITLADGTYICSGTLINNTVQDDKPYFLTAFHCLDEYEDGVLADPNGVAASMVVYWNFQALTCSGSSGSNSQNQTGAYFCAAYLSSDFALVELDEMPPQEFDVYYAGWDRSYSAPSSGVAIHHPKADLKKISIENHSLSITSYGGASSPGDGTHLRLWHWETGMAEPGSSGCPIFNPAKLLTGQLHGGILIDCEDEVRGPNWFGFLHKSWTGGGTSATRLSSWLDPAATGQTTLEGKDPNWCIITGDFDCDQHVNFIDMAILASQWRNTPGYPSADIAPEVPDGVVDMCDLAVFVEHWLQGAMP
jgi:lysyl endopeptidase